MNIKNKLHQIKKKLQHPEKTVVDMCVNSNYKYAKLFTDKCYIKCFYKVHLHKKLNLKNPQTFNEKLQWLKLYDRKPVYTKMADKALMKEYVAGILGQGYVIPTIGVYDSVDDVPFDSLPQQYVIKCTHDSGSTFICKDKTTFDIENVKQKLSKRLKNSYFWYGREWPYKDVKPRIIVEEFLADKNGNAPLDYKLFCFNGKMQFFKVDYNRFTNHRANYFDRECELVDFGEYWLKPDDSIKFEKPEKFDKIIEFADKLSVGIPFLRVDFYYVNDRIYVGELTFFPASGAGLLTGDGDLIMGRMLTLPEK